MPVLEIDGDLYYISDAALAGYIIGAIIIFILIPVLCCCFCCGWCCFAGRRKSSPPPPPIIIHDRGPAPAPSPALASVQHNQSNTIYMPNSASYYNENNQRGSPAPTDYYGNNQSRFMYNSSPAEVKSQPYSPYQPPPPPVQQQQQYQQQEYPFNVNINSRYQADVRTPRNYLGQNDTYDIYKPTAMSAHFSHQNNLQSSGKYPRAKFQPQT